MRDNITSDIEAAALKTFSRLSTGGFAVGINFLEGKPDWVHLTYPIEWQREYVDRDLLHEDATILYATSNVGHVTWDQLERLYPDNAVLRCARAYGLVEGNTVSVRHQGLRSVASAAGDPWDEQAVKQATAALLALHQIHSKTKPEAAPQPLVDVVRLMAGGHRDAEIAERLEIKIETVRQRRTTAQRLTHTNTPAELVAHAIRSGWI